jgi:hypothetical protein
MIKCRFVFEDGDNERPLHDPGFGIQPQFVDETLKFLGAFGVAYDNHLWVPEKAVFDVHQQAFVITLSHFIPEDTAPSVVLEPVFQPEDLGDQDDLELDDGTVREKASPLSPQQRRELFKLITKVREEPENE